MNLDAPIAHDVVFVGGGHSHALVLRSWAMDPLPGVRLTLISRDVLTPYSGMLPGYIAGHYSFEDIHIDLLKLCAWGGVRFIQSEMTGIDLDKKTLQLKDRPDLSYDFLSLDTGSTPTLEVPGASEYATPVKPVHSFIERWNSVQARTPKNLGVVGAGAGGFELVMGMAHRMKDQPIDLHWFLRSSQSMSDRPNKVGELALKRAERMGVHVHTGFDVSNVSSGRLHAVDGRVQSFDDLLWCTAASAPVWPTAAGLQTDANGFVATTETLQSASHPEVFATGDIGTQIKTPSAKAGVFAVRQAPVLFHNLRALVKKKPLKTYVPQKDFLSLVSAGDKFAIGSRSGFSFSGHWVWLWKNSIDKAFMNKFVKLPPMKIKFKEKISALVTPSSRDSAELMRCNGCGAKVPASILEEVLATLPIEQNSKQNAKQSDNVEVISGVRQGDDAARMAWPSSSIVQSVDQLRALIDDPYVFGRIATLHALSDVYASQACAHSAQVLLTQPFATPTVAKRELSQLMQGIVSALNEERCVLVGGHTAEGAELQVGFVVNATQPLRRAETQARATDLAVVLTQPIGVGILFAGLMQTKTQGVHIRAAVQDLLQSNASAAAIFQQHGVAACTDVTGFGLVGHLQRLAVRERYRIELSVADVPIFEGVQDLTRQGVQSTLSASNQETLDQIAGIGGLSEPDRVILSDPQTSGGLMALVPTADAEGCVAALRSAGYKKACVIGHALNCNDNPETAGIAALS